MSAVAVFAIHGFLGTPGDWDFLRGAGFEVIAVPVFAIHPPTSLGDWARAFNRWAREIHPPKTGSRTRVVLGYSLGGRLALHALQDPTGGGSWDASVIVSANPGLRVEAEKIARRQSDASWARRFETEDWNHVTRSWEALPVFAGRAPLQPRRESDHRRADLAGALRGFSLGTQADLRPGILADSRPGLWVTGERDPRFTAIAEKVRAKAPSLELWTAPGAAHRVCDESPGAFRERVAAFFEQTFR